MARWNVIYSYARSHALDTTPNQREGQQHNELSCHLIES